MIGTLPTETNTRAFNANNVASVYISSGYGDLATKSEVGAGQDSAFDNAALSLQNGIYGMSDPANLKGMVERFEVEMTQGGTSKGNYRVRLINPTDELEIFLFGIYSAAFPNKNTSFDIFKEASREAVARTTVNPLSETSVLEDILSRGNQLPFLYMRWGYGTKQEEGLSRIHKCVLFNCEYIINSNQDKVIELHLTDWFASLADSETFNIVPKLTKENCLTEYKQLKSFSQILGDLIEKYSGVYPGVIPMFDRESANMVNLDVMVNNLANVHWNEFQKYQKEKAELKPANFTAVGTLDDANLGLDVPDAIPLKGKYFNHDQDLSDANIIWLSAYESAFKFLGINMRSTSDDINIDPIPVSLDTDIDLPDGGTTEGVAFLKYKETFRIPTTEIGLLDFVIPTWEVPTTKTSWVVNNPLMVTSSPGIPQQPFTTPRVINYNTSLETQAEMQLTPPKGGGFPSPWVTGYLVGSTPESRRTLENVGNIDGNIDEVSYYPNSPEAVAITEYTLSFNELEAIVADLRKLAPSISPLSEESITMDSAEFDLLPTALLATASLEDSQPSWNPNGALIPFNNYLLYSPVAAAQSIIPTFSDPLTRLHPLVTAGGFQTKSGFLKPSSTGAIGYIDPEYSPEVKINNQPNITKFKTKHDYLESDGNRGPRVKTANPFMKLVPSPDALRDIENAFRSVQKQVVELAQAHRIPYTNFGGKGSLALANLILPGTPTTRDIIPKLRHSVEVSLGTGKSATPHITKVLKTLIAAINKLVIGEKDPFVIQQIDLHNLSPENLTNLFNATGLLKLHEGMTDELEESIKANKPTLLMIGRKSWLGKVYSDRLTAQVYSFPEITRTEKEYEDYIFLSYGQKDSIVTDLRFTGDIRTLYNIPRAVYASKQVNSLVGFFAGTTQGAVNELIVNLMRFIHESDTSDTVAGINKYLSRNDNDSDIAKSMRSDRYNMLHVSNELSNITEVDYSIHKDYLDAFPEKITAFTDEQLTAEGFKDPSAARKVASILGTKEFTDLLFPVPDSDDSKKESFRQLDVASFQTTLAQLEAASMDVKMNYVQAAQDEAWAVEITTLGIPEIDIMGSEFFARRVYLEVTSPRGGRTATGAQGFHWLSGVYAITGIKHELVPSEGFKTSLSLIKVPAATTPTHA